MKLAELFLNTKSIHKNLLFSIFDKLLRLVLGFVIGAKIVGFLGPELYGKVNFVQTIAVIFGSLATYGLESLGIRILMENRKQEGQTLGTLLFFRFCLVILSSIAIYLSVFFLKQEVLILTFALIFSLAQLLRGFEVFRLWFESHKLLNEVIKIELFINVLLTVLKIYFVWFSYHIYMLVLLMAAEQGISALILFLLYQKKKDLHVRLGLDQQILKDIFYVGAPLFLSSLTVIVYVRVDNLIIDYLLGPKPLGLYSAAVRISELFFFIPAAVVSAFNPLLLDPNTNENENNELFKRLFQLAFWGALAIAIFLCVFADQIVVLLYGANFTESAQILKIHIWSLIAVFWGTLQGTYNIRKNVVKICLAYTTIGATLNLILNFILIPRLGPIGAAYSTAISYTTSAFLLNGVHRKTREIFWMQLSSLYLGRIQK